MEDTMDVPKRSGDIRFLSFNPRGLKITDLQVQLQTACKIDVNVQGYSKVNANFLNTKNAKIVLRYGKHSG